MGPGQPSSADGVLVISEDVLASPKWSMLTQWFFAPLLARRQGPSSADDDLVEDRSGQAPQGLAWIWHDDLVEDFGAQSVPLLAWSLSRMAVQEFVGLWAASHRWAALTLFGLAWR